MALLEKTYGVREDGEIDVRPSTTWSCSTRLPYHSTARCLQLPPHLARELFANLCQYVAVAEGMPGRLLDHLNALPRAVQRPASDVPLTDLNVFDERYDRMGLGNFVWYEWQLLFAARAIYNAEGPAALRRPPCDHQAPASVPWTIVSSPLSSSASRAPVWPRSCVAGPESPESHLFTPGSARRVYWARAGWSSEREIMPAWPSRSAQSGSPNRLPSGSSDA